MTELKPPDIPEEQKSDFSESCSPHSYKISPMSIFPLFIVHGKSLKNMIPDSEFSKVYSKYYSDIKTAKDLFNLARFKCYDGEYPKALIFIAKAIGLNDSNSLYFIWKQFVSIRLSYTIPNTKPKKSFFCCSNREKLSKKQYLKDISRELHELPESLETLWCFIEISSSSSLKKGKDIEINKFYANKIKAIDPYYGYIAWGTIYINEGDPKGIQILHSAMETFPNRPEAYYLAWEYFYRRKLYEDAKTIAAAAFLKIPYSDDTNYYIIFCINLAKIYYITGKFQSSIELLYDKYLEHPNYPIFLYYFAKYCIKSEDFTMNGIAKGILKELLHLCDSTRTGYMHYWMCRSYLLTRQCLEAYKHAYSAISTLDLKEKFKINEMKKVTFDMKFSIEKIEKARTCIKLQKCDDSFILKCEEIKEFDKSAGEILYSEVLVLRGEPDRAIINLKRLISSSRLEINAYFKLLTLLPQLAGETFKELLRKASNSQITTQVWVKCVLLYAKYLFNISSYNHCFYTLRVLAKVLPPLPYSKIPYCLALQRADTVQELALAYTRIADISPVRPAVEKGSPIKPRRKDHFNARMLTGRIIADFNETRIVQLRIPATVEPKKIKRFKKLSNLMIDVDINDDEGIPMPSPVHVENPLERFSICSNPRFLYYIAKFSLMLRKGKEEALLAAKEYLELMVYCKNKNKVGKMTIKIKQIISELHTIN